MKVFALLLGITQYFLPISHKFVNRLFFYYVFHFYFPSRWILTIIVGNRPAWFQKL